MGIFSYFKRIKRREELENRKLEIEKDYLQQKNEQKLDFEKRKREIELGTLEKKAELERLKLDYQIKEEQTAIIEDFSEDDSGFSEENEGSEENMLLNTILSKVITSNSPPGINSLENQSSKNNPTFEQPGGELELSDDEIKIILDKIEPSYLKMAKSLPSETLKKLVKSKYPQINNSSLERAILILKEKN